jgi:hypothetical protein
MTARDTTVSGTRLDPAARRRAERRADRQAARNRLRRVRLSCHGWVRDPAARVGEWVWCDSCADWRRVAAVAE